MLSREDLSNRLLYLSPNAKYVFWLNEPSNPSNSKGYSNLVTIQNWLVYWDPLNVTVCPTLSEIQAPSAATIAAYIAALFSATSPTVEWAAVQTKPFLFSGAYNDLTGKPTIPSAQVNSDWNSSSGLSQVLNKPTIPVILSRSFSTPTFSSSTTATQLSTTRDALVSYCYNATVTISVLAGQSVTASLKYADNSGMTTNPVLVDTSITSNSGVLGLTQVNALKLSGIVPAGKFRQVTFSVSGATAPSALASGQEVLL